MPLLAMVHLRFTRRLTTKLATACIRLQPDCFCSCGAQVLMPMVLRERGLECWEWSDPSVHLVSCG